MYSFLLGIVGGVITLFSFPPFGLDYLIWFFPIPIFHAYFSERSVFLTLLGWGITFYTFSFLGLPFGIFSLLLVSSLAQLLVFTLIIVKLSRAKFATSFYILFPSIWVFFEFLQSKGFLGLPFYFLKHLSAPWLSLGVSLYSHPLARFAAFLGVWGLSLLILVIGGILHKLLASKKIVLFSITVSILVSLSFLPKPAYQEEGNIKIGLVQPCISEEQAHLLTAALSRSIRLSTLLFFQQSLDLVVWPLSYFSFAVPEDSLAKYISHFAKEYHCYIIVGFDGERLQVYSLDGKLKKAIEGYSDLPDWKKLFAIHEENMRSGNRVVETERFKFAVIRGLELGYPSLLLDFTNEGVDFVIGVGDEFFLDLLKANTVIRSIETGLYVALSTNMGPSLLVSPNGGIKEIPPFLQSTLFGKMSRSQVQTFFSKKKGYWVFL
ncbi:MAG: hypothetical protein H5T91_04920, partial [Synergistetes bacterium]|nr:hypothetical protein [Synergistota bacterium]